MVSCPYSNLLGDKHFQCGNTSGHKVSNLGPMGPNSHNSIIFVEFMVGHAVIVARKRGIIVLVMVNWVTCNENVL